MAHARTVSVEAQILPDVPESIMAALLIAAGEILSDAILMKWSLPISAPTWGETERLREAFACYPWPARVGGG